MKSALWTCLALASLPDAAANEYVEYMVDPTWKPDWPAGVGSFSAVAVSGDKVLISQRDAHNANPILVLDKTSGKMLSSFGGAEVGKVNTSFGSHGISVQPADAAAGRPEDTVWVMDFFNHTVLSFNLQGQLLGKAGRSGVASADPDKFGSVADAAFRKGSAFFSDGDGGSNNRIERWAAASGKPEHVEWVAPATPPSQRKTEEYMNPHSICYHETSDRLIVADREHTRIAIVNPDTGKEEGTFKCDAMGFGPKGKPFGVRTLKADSLDLLFVAVSNNPQDGKNQYVHIADISSLANGGSCTHLLQSISFAAPGESPKPGEVECHTPHLMGVDHSTGDVYLACVAEPGSNLVRLTQRKSGPVQLLV